MNQKVRKCIFWHVHPTKTQISLHVFVVWSVIIVSMKQFYNLGLSPMKIVTKAQLFKALLA